MEDVKVYMVVNLEIEDKETYLKYETVCLHSLPNRFEQLHANFKI